MCAFNRITLAYVLFFLSSTSVFGQGGLTITISNDTTTNILVTVYDLNANPAQRILSGQLMNGFATISVTVTPDSSGQGHLSWTATTLDRDMRQCGHRDKPNLNDGDTVHVYANDDCGS